MILLAVLTKELRAYFGLFLAYAIVAVALALAGFFFYTDLSLFILLGGVNLERGLWEFFFHDLRFVLLLLVPVLTARSFAEEKKLGTLDLLWTYPIPETSVILGKFLAAVDTLSRCPRIHDVLPFHPVLVSSPSQLAATPGGLYGSVSVGFSLH